MTYKLHAVIINKLEGLSIAKKIAKNIIKDDNKKFYRETEQSFRFRNIPKTKFNPKTFRTKVINPNVRLVFGKLKSS